jgi:hypothetical protein
MVIQPQTYTDEASSHKNIVCGRKQGECRLPESYMPQEGRGGASLNVLSLVFPICLSHRLICHYIFPGLKCIKRGRDFGNIRDIEAETEINQ